MAATNQTIDGKLNLQLQSLNFLEGLSKAGERLAGQLQIKLTAKGSLTKPVVAGELVFTNGSLSVPKSGLVFSPITAKLQSSNKHWQAQGSMSTGGHALTLKGQGNFSPQLSGQLNIQGENFPVIKTTGYVVNLSPQLTLVFNPTSFAITGTILIPSAQLKPISFSNTTNLSEDVVFVKKESATAPNPFNINTDVQIKMGQDVALDVKGLHGFLDGAIHVKQLPHGALSGIGELTIRDGKYKAYGQDLIVDEGQLLFTGGPIDNPSIRLRAIRKFSSTNSNEGSKQLLDFSAASLDTVDITSETTVGIELSGRLNASKIKLFSIPPTMSQSDILSMLILGKPASQASKSGGQLLLAAISSMNLDSGTKGLQLLDQLKQSLGIDFNLQNNPKYNQGTNQLGDGTALVVGKSLTKRIYVSYNVGLLQTDSNVLTLKYLLNKFFSIQVTASDSGSGLDLLYTHSKD
jgi:translocation and assembly module TamB